MAAGDDVVGNSQLSPSSRKGSRIAEAFRERRRNVLMQGALRSLDLVAAHVEL